MSSQSSLRPPFAQHGRLVDIFIPVVARVPLPSSVPDIAGALAEPPSVAVRAERRSGGVEGKDVQIIGGTIGILTALVTKARNPRSLIVREPDPIRRKRAADMGFILS